MLNANDHSLLFLTMPLHGKQKDCHSNAESPFGASVKKWITYLQEFYRKFLNHAERRWSVSENGLADFF